jgi:hypothetical protein
MEPSKHCVKARRNLVLFSGLLVPTATIGLDLTPKASISPLTIKDPSYIDDILAVLGNILYISDFTVLVCSAVSSEVADSI